MTALSKPIREAIADAIEYATIAAERLYDDDQELTGKEAQRLIDILRASTEECAVVIGRACEPKAEVSSDQLARIAAGMGLDPGALTAEAKRRGVEVMQASREET